LAMPIKLDRKTLEQALRLSLRRQGAIARFGTRTLVAIDLGTLLQQAVEEVAQSVDAEYVKIMEYRSGPKDLMVQAGVGWKDGVVGHATLPVHMRSPPGRSYLTSEPTRITDIRQSEEFDYSDLLKEHGVISLVNVPIAWDGHTYGVLEIDSRSFTDFLDDTIQFLHGFANFLAAAIQRKRHEEEREILFRELQHRIKNSLQMILSLLRLERRKGSLNGFDRVNDAVQAISLAYDQLQGSREIKRVSLDRYLGGLCGGIMPNMIGSRPVQVESDIEPVSLDFDKAVVLGLIVNELVTNSVKHAFSEDASGIIRVAFHVEEGSGILVVEDNGRGTCTDDQAEPGMGSQLLTAMARQIGGALEQDMEHRSGTRHTLRFPLGGQ
jgi:two-component system, sensor histidine kinase PdtaS